VAPRRGLGSRCFGFKAVGSLVLCHLWMVLWPQEIATGLYFFRGLVMPYFARARRESVRITTGGGHVHRRHNGCSPRARFFKRLSEAKVSGVCEPGFGLLAGGAFVQIDGPLGSLMVASAVARLLVQSMSDGAEGARAMELNDAVSEPQSLAERFGLRSAGAHHPQWRSHQVGFSWTVHRYGIAANPMIETRAGGA